MNRKELHRKPINYKSVCLLTTLRGPTTRGRAASSNLRLGLHLPLLEDKIFARYTLPNIMNIFDNSLKMRGSVVGASNEDVVSLAIRHWGVHGYYRHKSAHRYQHL